MIQIDINMPIGCIYEGDNGKTEYCPLCNHDDVPYCQYLDDNEAALGIDERPCYCPLYKPELHWIPCSERLPEEDVYVLISKKPSPISGNKFSVTIGMRYINRRSKKAEWRDSGFGFLSDDKVLAWMPMPEPYQEEGEEETE